MPDSCWRNGCDASAASPNRSPRCATPATPSTPWAAQPGATKPAGATSTGVQPTPRPSRARPADRPGAPGRPARGPRALKRDRPAAVSLPPNDRKHTCAAEVFHGKGGGRPRHPSPARQRRTDWCTVSQIPANRTVRNGLENRFGPLGPTRVESLPLRFSSWSQRNRPQRPFALRLHDRRARSTEVHRNPEKGAGLGARWRTTGEQLHCRRLQQDEAAFSFERGRTRVINAARRSLCRQRRIRRRSPATAGEQQLDGDVEIEVTPLCEPARGSHLVARARELFSPPRRTEARAKGSAPT
jgi:hypothetical protein